MLSKPLSALKSKKGIAGAGILVCYGIYGLIAVAGQADTVVNNAVPALEFLGTGPGVLIALIIAVVLVVWAANTQESGALSAKEESTADAPVISAWDDPQFKFTAVNNKLFRNETVPLDGFLYTNCTFENVTFTYKGEQPYGLVAFKIIGEDTALKTESAPLWAYSRLLNILGYIKQEVEKGDALRPDAKVARIEDGQVKIFESKDEENERIRREREKLEAERDALKEESELRRTERDAEARSLSFHVSEWLDKFLEDCKQENLQNQELMARYNQELSGKAVGTINDLKKFGLWKPNEQDRERFEHPENQQDIEGLSSYLRWVGLNL